MIINILVCHLDSIRYLLFCALQAPAEKEKDKEKKQQMKAASAPKKTTRWSMVGACVQGWMRPEQVVAVVSGRSKEMRCGGCLCLKGGCN